MVERQKDNRREVAITDIEGFVTGEHLLRKIERVMDYEWLYQKLESYYCADNGRRGIDPVVLIKMVLIQHLYGIPSLRQTYQRVCDTISYRWFLGYGLLDTIPHFATVSYAFCKRFPLDTAEEIFEHILNKAINNRLTYMLSSFKARIKPLPNPWPITLLRQKRADNFGRYLLFIAAKTHQKIPINKRAGGRVFPMLPARLLF